MALLHGCASLIIPHIIDQFVWNEIVHSNGAGPKGVKIGKLSAQRLEPLILDLINNAEYKTNAERIASQMAQEDFQDEIVEMIVG